MEKLIHGPGHGRLLTLHFLAKLEANPSPQAKTGHDLRLSIDMVQATVHRTGMHWVPIKGMTRLQSDNRPGYV